MSSPGLMDFAGTWAVSRDITDFLTSTPSSFTGTAEFVPDDKGLSYSETGILQIGATRVTATRRYAWRHSDSGIDVYFEDGRFFHAITPGAEPHAGHFCDPDQYEVDYRFSAWPDWQAIWRVRGPRKDYLMTSRYTRLK